MHIRNLFFTLSIFVVALAVLTASTCEEAAQALSTTISGTVYDDGAVVEGAFILVLEYGDTATAGMSLSNLSLTNSSGHYTVLEVEPGDYYICAVKDEDGNLNIDPGIDIVGYYGEVDSLLGISIPEKVTLENEDQDLVNIDIEEMYVLPGGEKKVRLLGD
ncbi:hypothetical protein DRQ36_05020 [bacterium]|nr:MAG: hypothetical protein DRQ36_05020 [bacterium]